MTGCGQLTGELFVNRSLSKPWLICVEFMRHLLFNLIVFFAMCAAAAPGATIDVGNHLLFSNMAGQEIEVYVTGGEQIAGIDFFAQVGDGGPELVNVGLPAGTDGPEITDVELKSGTIFASSNAQQVDQQRSGVEQVFFASLAIVEPPPAPQTVAASGLLARLTIDTTGLTEGTFDLLLDNVLPAVNGGPFATNLVADDGTPQATTIINGTLSIGGSVVVTSTGVPTMDMPGFTTWTVNATSDVGPINGIDITFTGAMNQVNPAGQPSIFTNANGFFSFVGADVSQDSQFLFDSGDILQVGTAEGAELLKAAITNISSHTGGAMSVDFAQIVIANGGSVDFAAQFDDGRGMAIAVNSTIPGAVPGDYNADGLVNAADYTRWRDQLGQSVTLLNENPAATTPGLVDQEDYDYWKSQFSAISGRSSTASVPEPVSWLLVLCAMAVLGISRSTWIDLAS